MTPATWRLQRRTVTLTRRWIAWLVCAVAFLPLALVAGGEIRVMTSGAFAAAHVNLSRQFERTTGNTIFTVTTTTGVGADSIPARLERRDAADVVILPEAALDALIADGLVVKVSKVALARSAIGMGVRAGGPKPDISTVDALKRTLLAAKSIAYSASVSGSYLSTELFPRLGIADQLKTKSRRVETERVGAVVARGEAEIGFQQISELIEVPGVDLVGPLPPQVQRVTVIVAGVATTATNPDGARALIEFFSSKEAAPTILKVGLELMGAR
jgi:molybdate transport system substrate-binding protein